MIKKSMSPSEEDTGTVPSMKRAILDKLQGRYTDVYDYLMECTALDPRFRCLPHVGQDERQAVFERLKDKVLQVIIYIIKTTVGL